MLKKTITFVVVPFLVCMLGWFFYRLNLSYQDMDKPPVNELALKSNDFSNAELEDYIVGVVACEMPALYEEEALKAQAIAARTYAAYKISHDNENVTSLKNSQEQCYIDEEEQRHKWQDDYDKYATKIKNIVALTSSIVMNKDDELFKSFYFSTSNGKTENSQAVFNEQNLVSVESLWDKEAPNYEVTIEKSIAQLESIFGPISDIIIESRNQTDHVELVKIADKEYTGIEIRKKLDLRSTDFDIVKENDKYIITTRGYGHGVGMSQYGANHMAKEGHTAEEILNYYYSGVEFTKIDV